MKFLVPNYSCLQNPWLGGYHPKIPILCVLCPQLNLLNTPPPPRTKFVGTPVEASRRVMTAQLTRLAQNGIVKPTRRKKYYLPLLVLVARAGVSEYPVIFCATDPHWPSTYPSSSSSLYPSWIWATCWPVPVSRIQKSLQRSTMIPSASWTVVFHYPG